MSTTRRDSIAYSALNRGDLEDDEDEDTTTLVGSPASPKFVADETEEGGKREHSTGQHDDRNSGMKGIAHSFLKEVDGEDMQDMKEWGFWEVCAVRSVRRMLGSLFLLSYVSPSSSTEGNL